MKLAGLLGSLGALVLATSTASAQVQVAKLLASDMAQGDYFGQAVSLSGDTSIVGEPENSALAPQAGAAYVFQRVGPSWLQLQKLTASDAASGAGFGNAVAISGDVAVIGASNDSPLGVQFFGCGSAYVFQRVQSSWVQTAKIWAGDPQANEIFGCSVSVSGTRVVVGARLEGHAGYGSGAAYVFELQGATWVQVSKLIASDGGQGAAFGSSVSIDGDLALIGASAADNGGGSGAAFGAAYVFQRLTNGWTQTQKLTASDAAHMDYFGESVAITTTTAFIGSGHSAAGFRSGAAYVFEYQAPLWNQVQELVGSDTVAQDGFGIVAVSGQTAVIGASGNADPANNQGAAYTFRRIGSTWTQTGKLLANDGKQADLFGGSVSISGDTVLVGAAYTDDACPSIPFQCNSGSAYVFNLAPTAMQYGPCSSGAPCGNLDGHGGCKNSTTLGSVLAAAGSGSVTADDLIFGATRLPANHSAILFMGGAQVFVPFGDGVRTVGSSGTGMYRFPVHQSDAQGLLSYGPGLIALSQSFPAAGHITAGQTWNFQLWYRDPQGPCGGLTNFSNGVQVAFVP
jgi:hypothetical protein